MDNIGIISNYNVWIVVMDAIFALALINALHAFLDLVLTQIKLDA